ncbi:hypothetical protein HK101_003022 [Irineochytrium annulatum]|nr:hypothetical protein HK101_003022 [Irineochytrium annulatum]
MSYHAPGTVDIFASANGTQEETLRDIGDCSFPIFYLMGDTLVPGEGHEGADQFGTALTYDILIITELLQTGGIAQIWPTKLTSLQRLLMDIHHGAIRPSRWRYGAGAAIEDRGLHQALHHVVAQKPAPRKKPPNLPNLNLIKRRDELPAPKLHGQQDSSWKDTIERNLTYILRQDVMSEQEFSVKFAKCLEKHRQMSDCFQTVQLSFGASMQAWTLPLNVAEVSTTIRHILISSESFIEKKRDQIHFADIEREVGQDVMMYLFHDWFKKLPSTNYMQSYKPALCNALRTLEAAVYLDLQPLADLCCDEIVCNFNELQSLENVSPPLLKTIMKRLSLVDFLCAYQQTTTLKGTIKEADAALRVQFLAMIKKGALRRENATRKVFFPYTGGEETLQFRMRIECFRYCLENHPHRTLHPDFREALESFTESISAIDCMQRASVDSSSPFDTELWSLLYHKAPLRDVDILINSSSQQRFIGDILAALQGHDVNLKLRVAVSSAHDVTEFSNVFDWMHNAQPRSVDEKGEWSSSTKNEIRGSQMMKTDANNGKQKLRVRQLTLQLFADENGLSPSSCAVLLPIKDHLSNYRSVCAEINGLPIGVTLMRLYRSLHAIPMLQSLTLKKAFLGAKGVCALMHQLSKMRSLVQLDISENVADGDIYGAEAGGAVAKWIEFNSQLRELTLSGNFFSSGTIVIVSAIKNCRSLEALDMSSVELSSTFPQFCKSVRGIKQLHINATSLLVRNTALLCQSISENPNDYQLRDLHIGENLMTRQSSSVFCVLFQKFFLVKLELIGGDGCRLEDDGCAAMFTALQRNTSLKQIDLTNQGAGVQTAEALARVLGGCLLEEIVLQKNCLYDPAAKMITAGVERLKRDVFIDLQHNRLSPNALRYLKKYETGRQVILVTVD